MLPSQDVIKEDTEVDPGLVKFVEYLARNRIRATRPRALSGRQMI